MAKNQQNFWKKLKRNLQNGSANFSTETLCFSEKKISVKANLAIYVFLGGFIFAGVGFMCMMPWMEGEAPWVGWTVGILFTFIGSLMLYLTANKKRPYFDLENNLLYLSPDERKTPIKINEISSFAVIEENKWHELGVIRNEIFYTLYCSKSALPYIHGKMLSEKFNLPWIQPVGSGFFRHYLRLLVTQIIVITVLAWGSYSNCVVPVKKLIESRGWIETEAAILYSEFADFYQTTTYRHPNQGGGLTVVLKPASRTERSCELSMEYEYEYKNIKYKSTRYDFFIMSPTNIGTKKMRQIVEEHYVGKKVKCFIDPKNPHEAVLSREIFWSHYLHGCVLPLLLAIALTFFVMFIKEICLVVKYCARSVESNGNI